MRKTRARNVMHWIEKYCVVPGGPERGQPVTLTLGQREIIRKIYAGDRSGFPLPLGNPLAAYLALYTLCGPDWREPVRYDSDTFTVWASAGPDLKAVLRLQGERITCPELGTQWPRAA